MSSSNKTPTIELSQYLANDKPKRADFNQDYSKIDEAVADINGAIANTGSAVNSLSAEVSEIGNTVESLALDISDSIKKSGDTMTGQLVGQSNTDYSAAQFRNIIISDEELAPGESELANGTLYFVYE